DRPIIRHPLELQRLHQIRLTADRRRIRRHQRLIRPARILGLPILRQPNMGHLGSNQVDHIIDKSHQSSPFSCLSGCDVGHVRTVDWSTVPVPESVMAAVAKLSSGSMSDWTIWEVPEATLTP